MKIELTDLEANALNFTVSWRLFGFSIEEELEILASIPLVAGEWFIPDFAVERIRNVVKLFGDQSIYEKMEAQTIRGTLHINLSGLSL